MPWRHHVFSWLYYTHRPEIPLCLKYAVEAAKRDVLIIHSRKQGSHGIWNGYDAGSYQLIIILRWNIKSKLLFVIRTLAFVSTNNLLTCHLGTLITITFDYTPASTKLNGGILFSPSPSVRLWTESCPLFIFNNTHRIHFIFAHLIKQLQKVCRV